MTKTDFSISEAVKFGWETTKENLWFLVGLFLFVFLLSISTAPFPPLGFLVAIFVNITILSVALKLYAGGKIEFKDYYSRYSVVLSYLVATVLYGALVMVGFVLLIIPGIYFMLKYQFYRFIVVEKGVNPLEALKESGRMTKGHMWNLFGFFWVLLGLNLLGLIALGVGLLVTVPTTVLAMTFVYKKLLAGSHPAR